MHSTLSRIFNKTEKDVQRTDRTHAYFSGDNPHLTVLNDILMTYCMWNFDLGTGCIGSCGDFRMFVEIVR